VELVYRPTDAAIASAIRLKTLMLVQDKNNRIYQLDALTPDSRVKIAFREFSATTK
jgi:hypothetical protein